jgi:rod shape-determining protein MreC
MKQLFKSRRDYILLAIAFAGHLVLLSTQPVQNSATPLVRQLTLELSAVALKCTTGTVETLSHLWQDYFALHQAREENRNLKEQLALYQKLAILSREKLKEDARLQVLAELQLALNLPVLKAKIIGADATLWYNSRIIDQGSVAGISKDCAVLAPEGIVGRVVHVSPHSSVVQLVTDTESGTGILLEKSRAQGILHGEGKVMGSLEYIRDSETVAPGEMALTSGLDQIYPKGLLVGYVSEVLPSKQIYQSIKVTFAVRIETVEDVLVILRRGGN